MIQRMKEKEPMVLKKIPGSDPIPEREVTVQTMKDKKTTKTLNFCLGDLDPWVIQTPGEVSQSSQ